MIYKYALTNLSIHAFLAMLKIVFPDYVHKIKLTLPSKKGILFLVERMYILVWEPLLLQGCNVTIMCLSLTCAIFSGRRTLPELGYFYMNTYPEYVKKWLTAVPYFIHSFSLPGKIDVCYSDTFTISLN